MTEKKLQERINRLMPNGIPRYIRCYDNGGADKENGTIDRYTVVYTGHYKKSFPHVFDYVAMSGCPFHPQGFGQHGESNYTPIDYPSYKHLGKKIRFEDLPEDCQKLVIQDYKTNWDLYPKVKAEV